MASTDSDAKLQDSDEWDNYKTKLGGKPLPGPLGAIRLHYTVYIVLFRL